MRYPLATALLLLLGCRPGPISDPTRCPEPPLLEDPWDPVLLLNEHSTPDEVVSAYRASRLLWRNEAKHRATLLDAYRKKQP